MSLDKSFEQWLQQLLVDYKNQKPDADIGDGSLPFIRFACSASALWGIQNSLKWVRKQQTPFRCDAERLYEFAAMRSLIPGANEDIETLRQRVLEEFRDVPANGKESDWEKWSIGYISPYEQLTLQASGITVTGSTNPEYTPEALIDGTTDEPVLLIGDWSAGAAIVVDFGEATECRMVMICMDSAGSLVEFAVQYSDDNSTWNTAQTLVTELVDWNKIEWLNGAGSHRYWRMYCTSPVMSQAQGQYITEMEWYKNGEETVTSATCHGGLRGGGAVDIYVLADGSNLPSNGLLRKLEEHLDTKRNATAKYRRAFAPAILLVDISFTVTGVTQVQAIVDAVTAYVNTLKLGEALYMSDIVFIARSMGAKDAHVILPATDIIPDPSEMVRINTIAVT